MKKQFILLMFLSNPAWASSDIQMLPPVDFAGSPCGDSAAGMLFWGGRASGDPIRCIPGFDGDADGNVTAKGNLDAKSYSAGGTPVMTILGSVECLTPEADGVAWMARNAHGGASCVSADQAACSAGIPILITVGHDLTAPGELGGFCEHGVPANSCQTALFFCVR